MLADFLLGGVLILRGAAADGRQRIAGALELLESDPTLREDARYLVHALQAVAWLGDPRSAAPALERRLRGARERGVLGVLVPALAMFAYGRAWLGDHAGAFADAGEAAELAEQLRYVADAAPAVEMLAWQSAARGLHDDARRELERATALVHRAGTADVAAHLALTAAFCALCRGDLQETVALLEARIAADDGRGRWGSRWGSPPPWWRPTSGWVGSPTLAERYAASSPQPEDPMTAALIARCRALGAGDDQVAFARFEEALTAHDHAPDPFETAHTHLLYGARLRQTGQRVAAREQLRASRDAFAAMDLTHWAQRATDELRATGETARRRGPLTEEPLTSQETRVALLVARGMSNREVAAALFLSPKTVEHHLSSVYRKRGLRSRTQLARAFAAADNPGG